MSREGLRTAETLDEIKRHRMEENLLNRIKGKNVKLRFATLADREHIYDMLTSPETSHFMFDQEHPPPTWNEFCEEAENYYLGKPTRSGSYILIEHKASVIGSISYACEYDKIPYCELDIWMGKLSSTGKGLGTESINLVIDFVNSTYDIDTFIIRPWIKNVNAIKAYEKCGFVKDEKLNLENYYSDEAMLEYGDGDYGMDETITLIKIMNKAHLEPRKR